MLCAFADSQSVIPGAIPDALRMRSDACDLANEASRFFGGVRALAVTTDRLNKYVAWCREQGLSNATINRDMSALRRAFKLAYRAGKIQRCPNFPHLKESAPRMGFVEDLRRSSAT